MSDRLPPLNTLRVFDAVARHMSFTKAAAELGMTQAAVSYQVKLLEDRLGRPMFQRLTRRLALTDAGAQLAPAVADAFARLREAFRAVSDDRGGVLSISSVVTFTNNWLVPRIGRFQVSYPELAVRIDSSTRRVDFSREAFDVGIRWSRGEPAPWPGLHATHLLSIDLTPVCAPALLDGVIGEIGPETILGLPLLGEFSAEFPHPRGDQGDWLAWFAAAGMPLDSVPTMKGLFATQPMSAAAALAGQGVALLTPSFFRSEIESGRLVELSPIRLHDAERFYLVCSAARRDEPKIRMFREWIESEITADSVAR